MWITLIFNGNTAYPHVDRLCIDSKKLFTSFTVLYFKLLIQFFHLFLQLRICLKKL